MTATGRHPNNTVILQEDRWNDFGYQTLFQMYLFHDNEKIAVGDVKICEKNQGDRVPLGTFFDLTNFNELSDDFCSLGQSTEYYRILINLNHDIAIEILKRLRDCSIDKNIYDNFKELNVFRTSLLRLSSAAEALDKARSIIFGEQQEVVRHFTLDYRNSESQFDDYIVFDFEKTSLLPSQINLLVGENGVGKTRMMSDIAFLMTNYSGGQTSAQSDIPTEARLDQRPSFYRLIAISFNAFDHFAIPKGSDDRDFEYYYRGLRARPSDSNDTESEANAVQSRHTELKSLSKLLSEISDSMAAISKDSQRSEMYKDFCRRIFPKWLYADDEEFFDIAIYNELSAGQRICLNIVSGLVQLIDNESLILFDEPENHLHPMMMSTIMNIFFDLLNQYSACAIIASHSPIVAQQVPSRYVQVIHRDDYFSRFITPPNFETFGAGVDELTSQLFEAHEYERDYRHLFMKMLSDTGDNIAAVEEAFGGELTPNARMVLRQIYKSRGN